MIESIGSMALALLDGSPLDTVRLDAPLDPVRLDATPLADRRAAVPMVLQIDPVAPGADESWTRFKDRVAQRLGRQSDLLRARAGIGDARALFAANALAVTLTVEQLGVVIDDPHLAIAFAELDPVRPLTTGGAAGPVDRGGGWVGSTAAGPDGTGAGVRVAVLDTGVDVTHPALTVARSVETCGEPVERAGEHGTHCAGVIASTDPETPGIAPGVDLINVKVLRADGNGRHTAVVAGVDRALDLSADVLSISLGFNHLPETVPGGHGWTCVDGSCPLCTAVDNAVLEGALVVVAAGNEHRRCRAIRAGGRGPSVDTELTCPGQARRAITVGAVHPVTHVPAAFSSHGPTAYGLAKPDLSGPGVDVRSTLPMPAGGSAAAAFGLRSGTSMAAAAVAGVAARLIEAARRDGRPDGPDAIRRRLLATCVEPIPGPAAAVGAGRLRLPGPEPPLG